MAKISTQEIIDTITYLHIYANITSICSLKPFHIIVLWNWEKKFFCNRLFSSSRYCWVNELV